MADQTLGAVGSLLGVLSKAIKDEAALLSGVEGDIQFIKDEMDSMNGFLIHLTKTTTPHDDQVRAWMKQVRDITYVADDCIKLYMRDVTPEEKGFRAKLLRQVPAVCNPCCPCLQRNPVTRDQLARRIRELKDQVREVSERRQRYDVKLPDLKGKAVESPPPVAAQDYKKMKEKRDEFLRALEDGQPPFLDAINLLPDGHHPAAADKCLDLHRLRGGDHANSMKKMLLRSLYAYPYGAKELGNLSKKLQEPEADVVGEVMLFFYNKLSVHYKS